MDIEKGKTYVIEINGMNHEGQGVGRYNGFTVFVDGALKGEKVEVQISELKKSYAVGKLLNIIEVSKDRIEPTCPGYERCGGCSFQHMNYKGQLEFKTDIVRESLKRIGKLEDVQVHPVVGMDNPFNYRNKVQFPVGMSEGIPVMGFYARRTHEIVDNSDCGIQDPDSSKVRKIVLDFIKEYKISVYDEKTGKGLLRHVMVRKGFKTGEIMAVAVINGTDLPKKQEMIKRLVSAMPEIKSIYLNVNTRNTNIILGERNIRIYGSDTIIDYIGMFKFDISPLSFFQVNPDQTEILYGKALEYADLKGNETVFDLYCGIGTISLFLSEKAEKVYGIEVVGDAVRDAVRNARANGIENIEFIEGQAEKVVPQMYERGIRADVAVIDPPRKGCEPAVLETLVNMQPKRIVYVSCNPATLARDLNYLDGHGYRTVEAQPVDMFPWTSHVECVVLMTNSGLKGKKDS